MPRKPEYPNFRDTCAENAHTLTNNNNVVSEWRFFELKFKLPSKYDKLNLKLEFDSACMVKENKKPPSPFQNECLKIRSQETHSLRLVMPSTA
jgi:hypothetical protein